jgi:hypothetical protein
MVQNRGAYIFKKYLGAMKKVHTGDPDILGTIVQNLVSRETWRPEFVHPWLKEINRGNFNILQISD